MTNPDPHPDEHLLVCGDTRAGDIEVLDPREVPLGGPRAMLVRRALPNKTRRMIGAWCFADTYGPEEVRMSVPPHPHIGLQTVSWLVAGEVHHRDSLGSDTQVMPGEMHLMTGGRGISHSEVSPESMTGVLHGAQLWVALPDVERDRAPDFESHRSLPSVALDDATVTVMLGSLLGEKSAATAYTPIVGAEVDLPAGASVEVPLRADFEHGVLALTEAVAVGGRPVPVGSIAYAAPGTSALTVATGAEPGRVLLLGGEPFEEELVMWWNFVGRTHDEVVSARAVWQAEREAAEDERPRFGFVAGHDGFTLPAPELPNATLRPRPRTRNS